MPTRNGITADYHSFVSDGIDGDKVKEDARKRLNTKRSLDGEVTSTVVHYHAEKVECTDEEIQDFFGPVMIAAKPEVHGIAGSIENLARVLSEEQSKE